MNLTTLFADSVCVGANHIACATMGSVLRQFDVHEKGIRPSFFFPIVFTV